MSTTSPPTRLRAWSRLVPVDVIALAIITIGIIVTHLAYERHGMCFNDPSWYFHFGRRVLYGDVPYRDFVFQVGPLPIYTDAAFQGIFGSTYVASLNAGLFIWILRVLVMWAIARRLTCRPAAALLCVYCAFDPLFGFAHNWSLPHSQLFITLSGLCFLVASRAEGRRALVYLALAGFNAAMVVSARQSSAVMIGLALLVTTTVLLVRKEYFTPRRFAAMWAGFAGGLVLVFGALAVQGALGPAIQQMFLDAPSKKGVTGIAAVLDAISGGALVAGPDVSWWAGFLIYLGVPMVVIAGLSYLVSREREISVQTIALLVAPVGLLLALFQRYGQLIFFSDVPRTMFTATTALVVLSPDRVRRWLGVEPIVMIGIGTLPLASDWALEMSFPGRGWGDAPSLVTGVILFALATSKLTNRIKLVMCGALAAVSLIGVGVAIGQDVNPFAKDDARDGTLTDNSIRSRSPLLRRLWINESRRQALVWLQAQVRPGSTCFVYANLPVLYDMLDCKNPTLIDSTTADFVALPDAEAALAALRAHPPDYIIAHENTWMNPPLTLDLHRDIKLYGGMNPKTSFALHVGLRELLDQYESVGIVSDVLGPALAQEASTRWDLIQLTRVYRRKR